MATPLQSFLTQFALAAESTWGTYVAATTVDQFVPVSNLKVSDEIETIPDRGFRSRAGLDQAYVQGFRFSKITWDSHFYPDVAGNYIRAILGGTDTVTGANPYTHSIPVLNTGLPPSYSLSDFYGVTGTNTRAYAGSYFDTLALSWTGGTTGGMLKASLSAVGKASQDTALQAKPTATYTTTTPLQPWTGAVTLNSVASYAQLIGLDLKLFRPAEMIPAAGVQGPSAGNVGQLEVTGKAMFQIADNTELNLFLNNTQGNLIVNFNQGASAQMQFQMSKVAFEKPTVLDRSKPFVMLVAQFRAIDNATDGGPVKCQVINTKASAY